MLPNKIIPNPKDHIFHLISLLEQKLSFSFVRFSDGETEILINRYLEINNGKTVFRGELLNNNYPAFDAKRFDPRLHQQIRHDLLASAMFNKKHFYKGIPTSHNKAYFEKDLMLRLNGGFNRNITFSDLLINSNYRIFRKKLRPLFAECSNLFVIANHRAKLGGTLLGACHLKVPDNFFATYDDVLSGLSRSIESVPKGSVILSSASSLTKILGWKLACVRDDVTFIDIGTALNDELGLDSATRDYHHDSIFKRLDYFNLFYRGHNIKW